jgi:hypothetical protein
MLTMARRPSLVDRVTATAASAHARRVYRRFMEAARRAVAVQERTLLDKIRRNADSDFGRRFGFDRVTSRQDFVRRVPILRYEDHLPYIERLKQGDSRALFGPAERVLMFAMTSGTTDQPKYIPVTPHFLREYRRGWNAFGIKALLDHPQAFLRGILQITSRMDETRTSARIPCGAITGLMAATQKRVVRKYYVAPRIVAEIDDPAAKYYTILRLALPVDVAFVITASPATQLKLARLARDNAVQLIREIQDGSLDVSLPVPAHVREALRPLLRPRPAEARRLEGLARQRGELLPRDYWDLAFLANWTGGTMGLYLREFGHYFGEAPVRDIGLLASEGRISIPVEDGTPAGILDVESHFFEFVPTGEIEADRPRTFCCHEVEEGQEYHVLMTTSAGLYRYHIGDVIRVVGFSGQAPLVEFLHRGEHVSSMAGEKLTEHQVVAAMQRSLERVNAAVTSFLLAPRWKQPPHYVLHVEAAAGQDVLPAAELGTEFDRQLASVNLEYASRRRSERLGSIQVNVLSSGRLAQRDQVEAERRRKGNEQYKHRYLYSRPGQDEDLFSPAESPGMRNQPRVS